jgi:histidine decarboxylase
VNVDRDVQARLDELYDRLQLAIATFIGYPVNAAFDTQAIERFLKLPMNNIGDPFVPSHIQIQSHDFEREVLATFAEWTHAAKDGVWGYVTSGGTEGNLYGLFLARELYPDGLVYYSEDTHYSVSKILRLLHIRNIQIKSEADGRIDLEDLRETIRIHRDVPPIVFANIGTTMKGAVDDLDGIHAIFRDMALHRHYIHSDAALSGMILPFVDDPQPWDFGANVDSIAVSGHKMVGSPIPCGVVLARREHVDRIARSIEYVGTLDTTIPGSRSGHTPLILWYSLRTKGREGYRRMIDRGLQLADYAIEQLRRIGLRPWRNPNSLTVVFERPVPVVVSKWQLAVQGDIAHVITMPHVTEAMIDALARDLAESMDTQS